MNNENKLSFSSDYMEGAHPDILKRLMDTNMEKSAGYGLDEYTESAKEKIREACGAPDADVYFLTGGTQANATMIDAMLRSYQGVMAAKSGHISVHEAGAIEFGGHKVLTLPENNGKITAGSVESCINSYKMDENNEHTIMPGMVYISHPTEFGTLYSLDELKALSDVCHKYDIPLYLDGARLAYALACPENDVRLRDIASLCDVFYIGGTKCGALFGEAVVIPKKGFIPHIFTIIKQHGALLAKGRIAGIQFETLFTNDLYYKIGQNAIDTAGRIKVALAEYGYEFAFNSPTNQIFVRLSREKSEELSEKIEMGFWENIDDSHVIMRIATSWATRQEDVDRLIEILKQ
ncbi:MAG: aminotransferase class V-fold PLP-dependent enzyme [Lachnospiraceae bacterium]|nr:aminotransferase class V-fold PLP-dependent enzyme [Lachnospiraceae bacterium]